MVKLSPGAIGLAPVFTELLGESVSRCWLLDLTGGFLRLIKEPLATGGLLSSSAAIAAAAAAAAAATLLFASSLLNDSRRFTVFSLLNSRVAAIAFL